MAGIARPPLHAVHEMAREHILATQPSPELQQLFAALCGNQAETCRFLGTLTGTVPIPEFFAPENVHQIISAR